jgi:type III restriction enzyme
MIKLPIMLTEHPTWQEALTDSVLTRQKLAEPARQELDFLRPIVLIQAESKDWGVTVKVVEDCHGMAPAMVPCASRNLL